MKHADVAFALLMTAAFAPCLGEDFSQDPNRLVYLDEADPFHVGLHFPRLETPQWIGEKGVEAVVTFGIDDMREHGRYEAFLRPILERLKQVDGRAPVSIFSNTIHPKEPHLQKWLAEGVTMEVHTLTHPCPILAKSNWVAAAETYHGSVDLLHEVPGNKPVAFRTPCCDSINSASPRLFSELMGGKSPAGNFVTMDSSVVVLLTEEDPALPAGAMVDAAGRPRFLKYVPFESFKTTIKNYPYPYVVNGAIWEMPFPAPSDWQSFNIQGKVSPQLLEDWKKALDLIVRKRGVLNFVLHPHGWCSAEQFVEFIDHAEKAHGGNVKFLNYREVYERMVEHLLSGQPLRSSDGGDNGVRLLDLNNDGYLDVVIGNGRVRKTRVWDPRAAQWRESELPVRIVSNAPSKDNGVRFGIVRESGAVSLIANNGQERGAWSFDGSRWQADEALVKGIDKVSFAQAGQDRGARLRDVDGQGGCELIVSNPEENVIFHWDENKGQWERSSYDLPGACSMVNQDGLDNGLRFVDLDGDGVDDVLLSNEQRYGVWLFDKGPRNGWLKVSEGVRKDEHTIPPFVRAGPHRNNGAWFHSGYLWVQNEETAHLPDLVERRSFADLATPRDK